MSELGNGCWRVLCSGQKKAAPKFRAFSGQPFLARLVLGVGMACHWLAVLQLVQPQLKIQQSPGTLVFLGHLDKGFQEGGILEIVLSGKVEGNGQEMPSFPLPPLQGLADLGEHVQVQLASLSVAFKEGNGVRGENHPLFGMEPADQGLGGGSAVHGTGKPAPGVLHHVLGCAVLLQNITLVEFKKRKLSFRIVFLNTGEET